MDITTHRTLNDLFKQLGLPSTNQDIRRFVHRHGPLPEHKTLTEADCWTVAQRRFLVEALHADDGDWTMPADQLNALLHAHPAVQDLPNGS